MKNKVVSIMALISAIVNTTAAVLWFYRVWIGITPLWKGVLFIIADAIIVAGMIFLFFRNWR